MTPKDNHMNIHIQTQIHTNMHTKWFKIKSHKRSPLDHKSVKLIIIFLSWTLTWASGRSSMHLNHPSYHYNF